MRLPTVGVLLWCTVVNALAAAVTPRQIAHQVLLRCVKSDAYAERALQASFSKHPDLSPNQRAQATELVYGCMRGMALLDYQLSKLTKADFARKTHPQTLCALRLGAYELLHMHTPDHAAVNEAVELAGSSKGHRSFANGVLRTLVRRRERRAGGAGGRASGGGTVASHAASGAGAGAVAAGANGAVAAAATSSSCGKTDANGRTSTTNGAAVFRVSSCCRQMPVLATGEKSRRREGRIQAVAVVIVLLITTKIIRIIKHSLTMV